MDAFAMQVGDIHWFRIVLSKVSSFCSWYNIAFAECIMLSAGALRRIMSVTVISWTPYITQHLTRTLSLEVKFQVVPKSFPWVTIMWIVLSSKRKLSTTWVNVQHTHCWALQTVSTKEVSRTLKTAIAIGLLSQLI